MSDGETPGDYLQRLRLSARKSTREVAKESGGRISHGYISQLENTPGKWSGVTLEAIEALAVGLGVPVDDFVHTVQRLRRGAQASADPLMDLLHRKNVIKRAGRSVQRLVPMVRGGFGAAYLNDESEVKLVDLYEHFPVDREPNTDKLIVVAQGLCMEPFIFEGDEVLVSLNPDCHLTNRLCVFDVPDEGITVKWLLGVNADGTFKVRQTKPKRSFTLPHATRFVGCVLDQHRDGNELRRMLALELSDA